MKTTVSIKMQFNPFYLLSQKKQSYGGSTCILQRFSSAGGTKEGSSNGKKYGETVNVHFDARIQFKQLVCDCTFQKEPNGMNK